MKIIENLKRMVEAGEYIDLLYYIFLFWDNTDEPKKHMYDEL
jgi:hypothetical protein